MYTLGIWVQEQPSSGAGADGTTAIVPSARHSVDGGGGGSNIYRAELRRQRNSNLEHSTMDQGSLATGMTRVPGKQEAAPTAARASTSRLRRLVIRASGRRTPASCT